MDYDHYWLYNKLDYTAPTAFAVMRLEQTFGALRLTQDREIKREALSQLHYTGTKNWGDQAHKR